MLIWEHTLDSNGKPCSNPRAIVPRWDVPNIVKEPVEVDVRSFGVRMPPSTRDNPNYGIMGMLHIIPPALAWLWRLIAPRGFNNPSIVTGNELKSEGVGSYWPFATGKRVKAGKPAAASDRGQPEHPLRADPEPAHRRLQGRLCG
ncbi:MAG: DUF4914 family protein [Butyricicoccaceae bacterium]